MMKNFMQTPKQKRVAIAANKTCFANSRKQVWQPKDAKYGSHKQIAQLAWNDISKQYGW
jgi:hypothetical protein